MNYSIEVTDFIKSRLPEESNNTYIASEVKEKFDIPQEKETVRTYVRNLRNREGIEAPIIIKENKTEFIENKNGASVSGQAHSLEDLLEKANVDLEKWEVDTFEIKDNSWDVTMKNVSRDMKYDGKDKKGFVKEVAGGITKTNKQFYIKVRLKKRTDFTSTQKFKQELIDEIKQFSPKVSKIKRPNNKSKNLLEIDIFDLHLGKLAWAEETGSRNYDIKIAVKRFKDSLKWLVETAVANHKIDEILFIAGQDLFNSDSNYPISATTAGTPQHDDARWQKVFKTGREMIVDAILYLRSVAKVNVYVVPGNHEFQKMFYLGDVLEARFFNDENVVVNNSPKTRKYFSWGRCLLGFAHGRKKDEGEQRLIQNMYHENKNASEYLYKEIHCGDIHHYKEIKSKGSSKVIDKYAEDVNGIIIKYLRTLMFNDEWEAKKGYISQKGAHCFIWNKSDGNIAEYKYNRY